jgi:hypothetical protein
MTPDPKNPSVLDARELDALHAPEFIVFYRQSGEGRPEGDWIMERLSDQAVVESGTLNDMLALIGTDKYSHARRATWAEDTLRYRSRIWDLPYKPIGVGTRT